MGCARADVQPGWGGGRATCRCARGRAGRTSPPFVSTGVDTVVNNPDSTVPGGFIPGRRQPVLRLLRAAAPRVRGQLQSRHRPTTTASRAMGRGCQAPAFRRTSGAGNINLSYGNGSRLRIGGAFSQNQGKNLRSPGGLSLNPGVAGNRAGWLPRPERGVDGRAGPRTWPSRRERALALDVNLSYQTDRFIESPFADGGPGAGYAGLLLLADPAGVWIRVCSTPGTTSTAWSARRRRVLEARLLRAEDPANCRRRHPARTTPTPSARTRRGRSTGPIPYGLARLIVLPGRRPEQRCTGAALFGEPLGRQRVARLATGPV